jgi:hypothetical protein
VARDDVRVDRESQQVQAVVERVLPHLLVPAEQLLAAPDVVHQAIQPAGRTLDPVDQRPDLVVLQMVDRHRDARAAGRRDHLGGLLDGLRPVDLRALRPGAPPGGVHRGARGAELHRDLPSGAAGRAGHQGDLSCQGSTHAGHAARDT